MTTILLVQLLILIDLQSQAIGEFPLVEYLTVDDGLSQSEITSILQDQKGFLWIGTRGGLNRYDGHEFKTFQNEIGNPNSIVNNSIESLYEDHKGNIWIGTKASGLSCYDPKLDRFKHYQYLPADNNSLRGNRILSICEAEKNHIWVATSEASLSIINSTTDSCTQIDFIKDVRSIRKSGDQMLVLGPDDLYQFDLAGNLQKTYHAEKVFGNLTDVLKDHQSGDIFLTARTLGLFQVDNTSDSIKPLATNQAKTRGINFYKLFQDKSGKIWIGSWNGGLFQFNPWNKVLTPYSLADHGLGQILGLYQDVLCAFEDRSGTLWFGTNGGGLCKVDERAGQLGWKNKIAQNEIFEGKLIWSMIRDRADLFWVGLKRDSFLYVSENEQPFTKVRLPRRATSRQLFTKEGARSIYQALDGTRWTASNFDFFQLTFSQNGFTAVPTSIIHNEPHEVERLVQTSCMLQGSDGLFWIGTQQKGLRRSLKPGNPATVSFKSYKQGNQPGTLKSSRISSLLEDESGRIWIGTYGGLHRFEPENDAFSHFSKIQGDENSLSSDIIICLHKSRDGKIWIGTPNGLNTIQKEDSSGLKFKCFQEKNGLPNNYIQSILEDENGNLWLGTNSGISKFDPLNQSFHNLTVADGLKSNSLSENLACQDSEGRLHFGGFQGINIFHPDSIHYYDNTPAVIFTGLKIFNQKIFAGQPFNDRVVLEKTLEYRPSITLKHDENVFTLEYAALDYVRPKNLVYAYKMEGLEDQWNLAGNNRNTTYNNLRAGEYTFLVKASSNQKDWSKPTALKLQVLPPWYGSNRAYLIYTLVFIGLLLLYRKIINHQNDLQNKLELSRLANAQEVELAQLKTRFYTNITHELRTPLTLIAGPVKELIESEQLPPRLKNYLLTIHQNTQRLIGLVNQLLDFRKAESGQMDINASKGNFVEFAKEVYLSFKELAHQKEIEFIFQINTNNIPLYFDRAKMEIVLCNFLSNAFKHTPRQGTVTLAIKSMGPLDSKNDDNIFREGCCEISVIDSGKGMPEELLEKIFDRFYQIANSSSVKMIGTGIGLALVKSIIDLHQGEIEVESHQDVGSTFTVRIAKGKNHFTDKQLVDTSRELGGEVYNPFNYPNRKINEELATTGPRKTDEEPQIMLVIEDNVEISTFIGQLFEPSFKILYAYDGAHGQQLAQNLLPDIIISDVMMPVLDGITLCKELKNSEQTCHIPVILLTARTSTVYQVDGFSSGADAYVTKPFDPSVLKAQVGSLLSQRDKLKHHYAKKITLQPCDIEVTPLDEQFLQELISIVEKNLDTEKLSREYLAKAVNMSPSTLYRKIKAITGHTTNAFIRSVRLKHAAQLLQTGQYPVSSAAYNAGFSDLKYFRNCFKEQFGMSPSSYSNKIKHGQHDEHR